VKFKAARVLATLLVLASMVLTLGAGMRWGSMSSVVAPPAPVEEGSEMFTLDTGS
jgi:hypothetical protein